MDSGSGNAPPVASSSRSPSKVAFKEQTEEYEYRSRYSDSASSESEQTTCSTSDSSASDSRDRCRRSHSRRSHTRRDDCRHRRRKHSSSDRHRSSRDPHSQRHRRSQPHPGTYSSSAFDAATAAGATPSAAGSGGPPPAPPPPAAPAPTPHPLITVCAGSFPHPPDQPLPVALLPPPGSGPFPSSPSPATTPTKAYTSPRSAQDPPPTLLLSSYGNRHHHHAGCPAAMMYGGTAAAPPSASLLEPMQMLALNGGGPAAMAPPPPPPPPPMYILPPAPGALPLSLPELPALGLQQPPGGMSMVYDETMQEVVLADAVMVKELGKQGHALVPLNDAYRNKLAALQAVVNGQLLAKREALLQQHARLAARAGEVAAQRAALEREVAILTEDMVGRIRAAESLKQGTLGREQADVGTQLEAIQRLLADIMAASAAGPVDFLNAYSRLSDTCARLVAKPFKQAVDVAADDLPREAAVYQDLVTAHEALRQLLGVKDAMIGHLLQERDTLQDELRQVVERYSAELSALEAQCQGYYRRLLALGAAEGGDAPQPGDSPGAPSRPAWASPSGTASGRSGGRG